MPSTATNPLIRHTWTALTATVIALLAGCAQTPTSPAQQKQAFQSHIDQEKVPFWRAQQAVLTKVMSQPPQPGYKLVWADLDEAERKQPVPHVLAQAMRHQNPQDRDASMIWLRWRIIQGNTDARYAYAYAHMLSTSAAAGSTRPMLPEAAAFLYLGRLSIAMDGARCADAASPPVAQRRLEASPAMAPLLQYIASGPALELLNARANALAIEQMRGERAPQAWVCSLGAASMLQAMSNGAVPQKVGEQHVVVDTSGGTPQFVGDDVKRQRQQAIKDAQLQALVAQSR